MIECQRVVIAQKAEIMSILHGADALAAIEAKKAAEKAEAEATDRATVRFYVHGWESHEVTVDTREDLAAQFEKIAARYTNDSITAEMAEAAYNKAIGDTKAKAEARIAWAHKYIAECEGKTLPTYAEALRESKEWQERNQSSYLPPVGHTVEELAQAKRIVAEAV